MIGFETFNLSKEGKDYHNGFERLALSNQLRITKDCNFVILLKYGDGRARYVDYDEGDDEPLVSSFSAGEFGQDAWISYNEFYRVNKIEINEDKKYDEPFIVCEIYYYSDNKDKIEYVIYNGKKIVIEYDENNEVKEKKN